VTPELFQKALLEVRLKTLRDAAGDVCPVCGGRLPGDYLSGPNNSGNYMHGRMLCRASAIWSRHSHEDTRLSEVKEKTEPLTSQ